MAGGQSAAAGISSLLEGKEVLVFCGAGGVGKTSVAASAALAAASRVNGKVLVLTIDPARRLADALGLEGALGNVARRVPAEACAKAGLELRGELWAAMLDTKQSWDELVLRHAPDEETAYRILDNRLYHNITARFVQSHDYIAMERLFDVHSTGEYDLIIIDTPPSRNAIDFLEAPARMAEFFGGRVVRWITMPYRVGGKRGARVINIASRPFYQVADRILGGELLQDVAEFFLNFQSMYDGFVTRARAVEALLHDRRTGFVVVTTLESAPLAEAERFCEELRSRRFGLGALVCNKTLPESLRSADGRRAADDLTARAPALAERLAQTGAEAFADPARTARVLTTVAESFQNFALVATREEELRAELASAPEVVVDVPELSGEVADLEALVHIADRLAPR